MRFSNNALNPLINKKMDLNISRTNNNYQTPQGKDKKLQEEYFIGIGILVIKIKKLNFHKINLFK